MMRYLWRELEGYGSIGGMMDDDGTDIDTDSKNHMRLYGSKLKLGAT